MISGNLQLRCVQPPTFLHNLQLPHGQFGCHGHGGHGGYGETKQ